MDAERWCVVVGASGFARLWEQDVADVLNQTAGKLTKVVMENATYDEALAMAKIINHGLEVVEYKTKGRYNL